VIPFAIVAPVAINSYPPESFDRPANVFSEPRIMFQANSSLATMRAHEQLGATPNACDLIERLLPAKALDRDRFGTVGLKRSPHGRGASRHHAAIILLVA